MKFISYKADYKYQLVEMYSIQTNICLGKAISAEYISLHETGLLIIYDGYCWDGTSGPVIDTKENMRGSLVHDALYQLMRLGLLPQRYRKPADQLFMNICVEDGVLWLRAWFWKRALRRVGFIAASPSNKKAIQYAPGKP